jgi:hypothetical protein
MAQTTVNERIKILVDSLGISVRAFSELVGESNSNVNNYIGERQSMPPVAFLEKIVYHIENINPKWLITGREEPFIGDGPTLPVKTKISGKKNAVNVAGANHGTATQNNYTIADCEKERDTYKVELDKVQQQVEHLQAQLITKDALIASKEETIDLLKAAFNRPN